MAASRAGQPAARIERGPPRLGTVRRTQKRYLEPPGGQQRAEPLGPFDQRDAVGEGVLDAEFPGLFGARSR